MGEGGPIRQSEGPRSFWLIEWPPVSALFSYWCFFLMGSFSLVVFNDVIEKGYKKSVYETLKSGEKNHGENE